MYASFGVGYGVGYGYGVGLRPYPTPYPTETPEATLWLIPHPRHPRHPSSLIPHPRRGYGYGYGYRYRYTINNSLLYSKVVSISISPLGMRDVAYISNNKIIHN